MEYSPPEDIADTASRPFSTPLPGPVLQDLNKFYASLEATAREEADRRYARKSGDYAKFEAFRDQFSQ